MNANSMAPGWYYSKRDSRDQQTGPMAWEQLYATAQAGTLEPGDLVWHQMLPGWTPAGQVPGLFPAAAHSGAVQPIATQPIATHPIARRRSWLYWVIPLVVLLLVGAGLGVYFGFLRDGDGAAGSTVSGKTTTTEVAGATTTAPTTTTTMATTTTTASTTTTTMATTTTTIPYSKWGAAREVDGLRITVKEPATDWNLYYGVDGVKDKTMKIIMAKVVIENMTESSLSYSYWDFELTTSSRERYYAEDFLRDVSPNKPPLGEGDIEAGGKVSGYVAFVVPNEAAAATLERTDENGVADAIWGY